MFDLGNQINQLDRQLMIDEANLNRYKQESKELQTQIDKNKQEIDLHNKASYLLQKTAEKQREYIKDKIEKLGTAALQSIFGPQFELNIELNQSKAKPECKIYVTETIGENKVTREPQDFTGGGVVDIVGLSLRFAMLQVYDEPRIEGSVILDEPGKHVSKEYSNLLSEFLKILSESLDRQIIFVTHNEYMANSSDIVIRVNKEGDTSKAVTIINSND